MNTAADSLSSPLSRPRATPRDRRAFLRLPSGTLARARLLALCLCLVLAADLIAATSAAPLSRQHWQLALAGEVWLCWHWFRDHQRRRSSLRWIIPEGATLFLVAMVAGPDRALPVMYCAIGLRALLDDEAVTLTWLSYVVAYAGAVLLSSTSGLSPAQLPHLLTQAGGLAVTASLASLLAALMRQQEQVMAGLSAMERTGASSGARPGEQVYQAALQAVLSLVASPDATARLVLGVDERQTVVATLGPSVKAIAGTDDRRRFTPASSTGGVRPPVESEFPLFGPSGLEGKVVLMTPQSLSRVRTDGLSILASHIAIAVANVRLREELALSVIDARYRSVVLSTSDLITIVGRDGQIRYQAPSVTPILGYRQPELIGKDLSTLLHPADALRARSYVATLASSGTGTPIEWRLRHVDGTWRQFETVGTNLLHDPHIDGIILTSRDIGDRKWLEQRLQDQTARDPLTGLANRTLFGEHLAKVLEANRFPNHGAALLFLDLDNFKAVDDNLGHEEGDRLLRAVAERLRSCLRPGDLAARLGGDEFAILLDTESRAELAPTVAERLLAVLRAPFLLASQHIVIGASIGIAIATTSADNPGTLLQKADRAMCEAKRSGKGVYAVAPMTTSPVA